MTAKWILSTALALVAASAAAGAQASGHMDGSMTHAATVTYTGCVTAVNHGGSFMLTKIEGAPMHDGMAGKSGASGMEKQVPMDDMKESMKDGMKDGMKDDMKGMKMDGPSKGIVLAGYPDVKKHVGQHVSVTGSLTSGSMDSKREDLSTLTVKSLKVLAKSCS